MVDCYRVSQRKLDIISADNQREKNKPKKIPSFLNSSMKHFYI